MNSLNPTFWRTFRVLSEKNRLACLLCVIQNPGVTVNDVADSTGAKQSATSVMLRALQSRGLLSPRRVGKFVHYFPVADPQVPSAAPLLLAMSEALLVNNLPASEIRRIMTAFTHPRRIQIAHLLTISPMTDTSLSACTEISWPAVKRHLNKLQRRGFASCDESQKWHLICPDSSLARAVMKQVVSET